MSEAYGQDWWFYPIEITDETNLIQINTGQGDTDGELTTGLFYWYIGQPNTSIPSMDQNVFAALDAVGWSLPWGEFEPQRFNPLKSPRLAQAGFDLSPTQVVGSYDLLWANSTADSQWFGWPQENLFFQAPPVIRSPFSQLGIWRAENLAIGNNAASDKRARPINQVKWSTARARGRVSNTDFQERFRRYFMQWIQPVHIYGERAQNQAYADIGGVGLGNVNNGFINVWQALSRGLDVYVLHNTETLIDGPDLSSADFEGKLEKVSLASLKDAGDPNMPIRLIRSAGELYNIDLQLIVEAVDSIEPPQ